jgi:hypothetical protein
MAISNLLFADSKLQHGIRGKINAIAIQNIGTNILPEIGELKSAAGLVGQFLALSIAIAAKVENQTADGIGAAAAIIENFGKRLVSQHALILFKCVDQVKKRLNWQLVPGDRIGQGDEDSRRSMTREAVDRLPAKIRQKPQGLIGIAGFITQIIGHSAKRVDVAKILPKVAREQKRDDGEILVVAQCQPTGLGLGIREGGCRGAGHGNRRCVHELSILAVFSPNAKRLETPKIKNFVKIQTIRL